MSPPSLRDAFLGLCERRGLSVAAVARAWGTSRAWVYRVRAGEKLPSVYQLRAIAEGEDLVELLRMRADEAGKIELAPHHTEEGLALQIALQIAGDAKVSETLGEMGWVRGERAAIVAYLRDRARWLRAESAAGGAWCLQKDADVAQGLADLIEKDRHHGGGHPR